MFRLFLISRKIQSLLLGLFLFLLDLLHNAKVLLITSLHQWLEVVHLSLVELLTVELKLSK